MKNKKMSLLSGSMFAAALFAVSGPEAQASGMFHYSNLGSAEELRINLPERESDINALEMKCGGKTAADSSAAKKGKEAKCGEGKCGEGKCGDKKAMKQKKGKEGKCGDKKSKTAEMKK